MANRKSKNEKVSEQIANAINDLTLDLEQIGTYLASNSNVTYRRIMEIAEAAKFEREERVHDTNYIF